MNSLLRSRLARIPNKMLTSRLSLELKLSSLVGVWKKPSRELMPTDWLVLMPSSCTPSLKNPLKSKLSWRNGRTDLPSSLFPLTTTPFPPIPSESGVSIWSSGPTTTWELASKPCKIPPEESTKTNPSSTLNPRLLRLRKSSDSKVKMNSSKLTRSISEKQTFPH